MSENGDESRTPEALRARFEPHLMQTFHDHRVLFEEGRIRLHATAQLECDAWGVSVRLEPETERDPSPSQVLGKSSRCGETEWVPPTWVGVFRCPLVKKHPKVG